MNGCHMSTESSNIPDEYVFLLWTSTKAITRERERERENKNFKFFDITEKKKDIRAWHTFYPLLFVTFNLVRKRNGLEELLGIGSWSGSVQGGCFLVIIRITNRLDMNVSVHAIRVKVFVCVLYQHCPNNE